MFRPKAFDEPPVFRRLDVKVGDRYECWIRNREVPLLRVRHWRHTSTLRGRGVTRQTSSRPTTTGASLQLDRIYRRREIFTGSGD